jgi:Skp family chaperone for outer membrane proteins
MRLVGLILAGALLLPAVHTLEAQGQDSALRMAFIDSQAIINEAPGAREAQDEFRREMERFRAEHGDKPVRLLERRHGRLPRHGR